jgi:hypothetical protein
MKACCINFWAGLLAVTVWNARAEDSSPPARTDYVSFRIITERNIFNQHRTPGRANRPPPETTRRESDYRPRSETFALLGTMIYEKGRFAVFDGSGSEFRKVLQPADQIAGFKIAGVDHTCVKLESTNGQSLDLCVGMQMKRRDGEEWQMAGRVESADNGGSRSSSSSASSSSSSSASGPESEEVLRRLMQRREEGGSPEPVAPPTLTSTPTASTNSIPPKESSSSGDADEVLKRLMQKREQELNR